MIFNLNNFVMKTLKGMKEHYSEFQVREYALNWYSKGVLSDDDMLTIEGWYYVPPIEEVATEGEDIPTIEEPTGEEVTE